MSDKPARDRISAAAIVVRNAGFPDVSKWMMARDKKTAHVTHPQRRIADVAKDGKRVRGGARTKEINWSNPDIQYLDCE